MEKERKKVKFEWSNKKIFTVWFSVDRVSRVEAIPVDGWWRDFSTDSRPLLNASSNRSHVTKLAGSMVGSWLFFASSSKRSRSDAYRRQYSNYQYSNQWWNLLINFVDCEFCHLDSPHLISLPKRQIIVDHMQIVKSKYPIVFFFVQRIDKSLQFILLFLHIIGHLFDVFVGFFQIVHVRKQIL